MHALFELGLLHVRPADLVLGKVIRAVLIVVAVLVALQQIGFDLTLLTVFGGALGVGIGLGLQKLASNYIAGFTILLDRSIRIGDLVTVDNRTGVVSKATSRYVVVRSGDGVPEQASRRERFPLAAESRASGAAGVGQQRFQG